MLLSAGRATKAAIAAAAALVGSLALALAVGAASWTVVSSPNASPGSQLFGVACASARDCWAVGASQSGGGPQTLIEHDTGAGWTIVSSPNASPAQNNVLYGVACASARDCWAVGYSAYIVSGNAIDQTLIEHYTGSSWTIVSSPNTSSDKNHLSAVTCANAGDCWAVGNSEQGGGTVALLIEHYTGSTWTVVTSPNAGAFSLLNGVTCPSAADCWAVGNGGGAQTLGPQTLIEHYTGSSWTMVSSPSPGSGFQLYGVFCASAADCWAVGGSGTQALIEHYTGSSWTIVTSLGSGPSSALYGVFCASASDCWAVGSSGQFNGNGSEQTLIEHYTGSNWTIVSSPSPDPGSRLQGVSCASAGDCWAVGSSGLFTGNGSGAQTLIEEAAGQSIPSPSPVSPGSSSGGGSTVPVNPPPSSVASSMASSLPTPAAAFASLLPVLINALIVLALILLVTFPAQLFNRTYDENHARIQTWWERRLGWTRRPRRRVQRVRSSRRGAVAFAAVVVVGALLGGLLDPGFGANLRTTALVLGIFLALLTGAALSAAAAGWYRRGRGEPGRWELRALPTGLLVAGLCVLVSRLAGFLPGYLYGVIGGVAFAGQLAKREEGHLVAISSVAVLLTSVVAWLLWVPVTSAASQAGAGFAWALLQNFLAAVFVSGLVGLVIGLVPLRFLPGEKLAAWHWGAWTGVFAVAAFALLQIMLRPQSATAHAGAVPFWTTLGLFLIFGAASVTFWAYFRVRRPVAADGRGSRP